MLMIMEDTVKIFVAGFKKWAKLNKVNQTKIGNAINRNQTTISDYWNEVSRPSTDYIKEWVSHFELDYDEILQAGRRELRIDEQQPQSVKKGPDERTVKIETTEEWEHFKVIRRFRNKSMATDINHKLVEIEKLSMPAFAEIYALINKRLKELKSETEREEPRRGTGTLGE